MTDHELVPYMHTTVKISLRKNDPIIRLITDPIINSPVRVIPSGSLIRARNREIQSNIGIFPF